MLRGILFSMRPHQWVKNAFVLAPLVFAQQLTNPGAAARAALATVMFIAVSGSVYLLNDCADVHKDRAHPVKCRRPIPSGQVPIPVALRTAAGLTAIAVAASMWLSVGLTVALALYAVLNLAYSLRLKRIAFLDVGIIATGFLLRVLAGAFAIDVPVSAWLLGCTFGLAVFLGLGKRRHELGVAREKAQQQRDALRGYSLRSLDIGLLLSAAATIAAYTGYTFSAHTREVFGTQWVPLTVPFIVVGLARFATLVSRDGDAVSPTERMIRDPLFVLNLAGWALLVIGLIYS